MTTSEPGRDSEDFLRALLKTSPDDATKVREQSSDKGEQHITAAGNTVVPAILALEALGYTVEVKWHTTVVATDAEGRSFVARDPVTVLGLVKLVEVAGWEWMPTSEQITDTMRRFPL